jgi:sugar phosphate permease
MLPMNFFRNRRFSLGSGVVTFAFLVMVGFFFLITQYFQFVRGSSPVKAGVATLPFALTMVVVAPRSDGLVRKLGVNKVIASGFGLIASGFVVFGLISPSTSYMVVLVGLVLLSSGMGLTTAPATGAIMSAVPLNKAGVGSAVNDTTREFGGALGIAALGSIVASGYRSNVDTSGLPADVVDPAGESVGAAIQVARRIGGDAGEALVVHAGAAFTDAINVAMFASAGIAVVVGCIVFAAGRDLPADEDASERTEPQTTA